MIVVNMFGGPGTGKTSLALAVAAALKMRHPRLVTEFVGEAAKEFVWEGRGSAMRNRILMLGEHSFRLTRLDGLVDLAVTDGPVLLNRVYGAREGWPPCYADLCAHAHAMHPSPVLRDGISYERAGRRECEAEGALLDAEMAAMLSGLGVPARAARSCRGDADRIADEAAAMARATRDTSGNMK